MSHQIYYTSAPEGLKPGSHGFCTVGATEGIPRALRERLETLSGYRHEAGVSPVVHAHWLLNLAGKEYHVLSRICDSGTDYTQRTNCFAHHLALENGELPPGGPAWLLRQPGILMERWDGQVGTIPSNGPLPRDGGSGGGICHQWAAATGDAGWAGVLAEAFLKSPGRPVCILYRVGQEMLPLLVEAIGLLPAGVRWHVTFSTYFTSMPPGAVCGWRCCLVGTPAATAVLRQVTGAGGTVINLADVSQLRKIPETPLVQFARTGVSPIKAVPVPEVPAPAPEIVTPPVTPAVAVPEERAAVVVVDVSDFDDAPARTEEPGAKVVINRNRPREHRGPPPRVVTGMMQVPPPGRPSVALPVPPSASKRALWPWVVMGVLVFLVVLLIILLAMALRMLGPGPGVEPSPAPVQPPVKVPPATPPVVVPPVGTGPGPVVVAPVTTQLIVVPPVTTGPVVVATLPAVPTQPIAIVPPTGPRLVTLSQLLATPPTGTVMRSPPQTIALPAGALREVGGVASLTVAFPGDKAEYKYEQGEISGTFIVAAGNGGAGRAGCSVKWKDVGSPVAPLEVLTLEVEPRKLAVTWQIRAALDRPEISRLAYWVVQQSGLVVSNFAKTKSERLLFKPLELPTLKLGDAETAFKLPYELPTGVVAQNAGALPAGWQSAALLDWPGLDPAQRTAENVSRVVSYKKPNAVAGLEAAAFELTLKPGFTALACNWAKRMANDQTDLVRYMAELKQTDLAPARRDEYTRYVQGYQGSVASYQEVTALDVALLLPNGLRIATLRVQREAP